MKNFEKYIMNEYRVNPKWRNLVLQVSKECDYASNNIAEFVEDLLENCNLHSVKGEVGRMIRNA